MLWPPQGSPRCERLLLCGVGAHACCPTLGHALSDAQHRSSQICTIGVSDCLPGPCASVEAHRANGCNLVPMSATLCKPSTRADLTALVRSDTLQRPADRDRLPCSDFSVCSRSAPLQVGLTGMQKASRAQLCQAVQRQLCTQACCQGQAWPFAIQAPSAEGPDLSAAASWPDNGARPSGVSEAGGGNSCVLRTTASPGILGVFIPSSHDLMFATDPGSS